METAARSCSRACACERSRTKHNTAAILIINAIPNSRNQGRTEVRLCFGISFISTATITQSQFTLLGREGKENERDGGWGMGDGGWKQKRKRQTPQENDQKAFQCRTNLKFVIMQIWVKGKSCYIHATTDNHS